MKAGGSVTVETAILSLVTKSANDSATALGELLGGSEAGFARMMTAKARQLGMTGTIFRNAHGLPNTGAAFDGARHGDARHRAARALSAVLFLFLDPLVQIRQAAPRQPQPAARPRQGRRRHQDRLHPRLRLQPRFVGVGRQPPHRRRRHGRPVGAVARQPHGRTDPHLAAEGFGQARRRRCRRQGQQRIRQFADPRARRDAAWQEDPQT